MAMFIGLIRFTGQGLETIKESPARSEVFRQTARSVGATVEGLYWTSGEYDGVVVLDAPDDRTASSLFLTLGRTGNVRTHMLRAFDKSEMEQILQKVK